MLISACSAWKFKDQGQLKPFGTEEFTSNSLKNVNTRNIICRYHIWR